MSDGEVNELIATLERSNLRRTAAVFKERFDALTAENERLTRELEDRRSKLLSAERALAKLAAEFGVPDSSYMVIADSVIDDLHKRASEAVGKTECIVDLERQIAAAQQRLASLAVDPAKREELALGAWRIWYLAYFGTEPTCNFADISDTGKATWTSIVDYLVPVGDPEVAELQRQLAGATKRLAELTKPADGEELAKAFQFVFERRIGLACWAACGIPWKEAVKEGIRNVRAPLLQQIAELTEKLDRAHTRIGELDWELGRKNSDWQKNSFRAKTMRKIRRLKEEVAHQIKAREDLERKLHYTATMPGQLGRIAGALDKIGIAKDQEGYELGSAARVELLIADRDRLVAELAEATKGLAELTKPADEIELRKVAWANYGAIYAQQKGEPLEPYESSTPERRARIDKAADAVAARVRAPLVQQIAELNEKLEAAHERIKGQCEQIGNHGRCIVRQRETIKRFKADHDRLAAELSTAKQALAAARGEVERVREIEQTARVLIDTAKQVAVRLKAMPFAIDRDHGGMLLCHTENLESILNPSPAPANPAASEPDDSSHTPETAHTSSSQSDPAERRFVCPKCGCTNVVTTAADDGNGTIHERIYCGSVADVACCGWSGTWADVEAAKREQENPCLGILDHKWLDPVCVGGGCQSLVLARLSEELKAEVEWRSLGIKSRDAIIVRLKQQLAAANQAREAERQRADGLQTRLEAFERSPDEKQKSIWELEEAVSEAEERANENARLLHEQRQRAEAAEAAVGVMRETIAWISRVAAPGSGVRGECERILATAPGRAADELRAGKALAGKIRDALCSVEAIAHVERALADYDKALAQGEQGCGR